MNAPVASPSSPSSTTPLMNATQEKILSLLGDGFPASIVASSIGCTEGYVSQLLSLDWFANLVQEKKFLNLQKHTVLDNKYDSIEERLLEKLEKSIPLIVRPGDITRTLQTINSAKRRGAQSHNPANVTQTIVNLTLPTAIIQRFISNANNQIVEVQDGTGKQSTLVTVASGALERLSREASETKLVEFSSCGDNANSESSAGEVSSSERINLSEEVIAAQARLGKSIPAQQKITAADL